MPRASLLSRTRGGGAEVREVAVDMAVVLCVLAHLGHIVLGSLLVSHMKQQDDAAAALLCWLIIGTTHCIRNRLSGVPTRCASLRCCNDGQCHRSAHPRLAQN
jgi:hypothetical protein